MNKRILHWSYRDFKKIPDDLLQYDEFLEEIYLKENFISYIPQWLFQLTNLKFLQLSGNTITYIPREIYLLENLEFFDLSNNKIDFIPNSIGQLKKLEYFNINGNCIVTIPNSIGGLRKLESFDLGANLIHFLPFELSQCCRLRNIVLNDNVYLQSIPEVITNLPHLCSFCADRCGLLYLPALLTKNASHIRVFNNQFLTHIPITYEKHISRYYDIYHPPFKRTAVNSPYFWIKEHEDGTFLLFPFGTRHIYEIKSKKVFSLFDTCLQTIYKYFIMANVCNHNIPRTIKEYIRQGPLANCSSSDCNRNLFTEYYVILVKRLNSTSKMLLSCTFCSTECANSWITKNKSKYYSVEWSIL